MGLTTLEKRRKRGDLIQLFKICNNIDKVIWPSSRNMTPTTTIINTVSTRRHDLKIERELVKNCEQCHNFFSDRVVNNWNRLPEATVRARSVNSNRC